MRRTLFIAAAVLLTAPRLDAQTSATATVSAHIPAIAEVGRIQHTGVSSDSAGTMTWQTSVLVRTNSVHHIRVRNCGRFAIVLLAPVHGTLAPEEKRNLPVRTEIGADVEHVLRWRGPEDAVGSLCAEVLGVHGG